MIEKQMNGLSPTNLRIILCISMAILILFSGVGFWFFKEALTSQAVGVRDAVAKATVSDNDIVNLQNLQQQLEKDSVAVKRTQNIVADSKSYQYQDQIIKDLNTYASAANITLSNYTFNSSPTTSGTAPAPGTTATATPAAPSGLKTTSVSITIKNPVDYESVMRFIHSIEINLTKMQLTGISLAKDNGTSDTGFTINPLTLEVYIR